MHRVSIGDGLNGDLLLGLDRGDDGGVRGDGRKLLLAIDRSAESGSTELDRGHCGGRFVCKTKSMQMVVWWLWLKICECCIPIPGRAGRWWWSMVVCPSEVMMSSNVAVITETNIRLDPRSEIAASTLGQS